MLQHKVCLNTDANIEINYATGYVSDILAYTLYTTLNTLYTAYTTKDQLQLI